MKRFSTVVLLMGLIASVPALAADKDEATEKRPSDFGVHGWGLRFGAGDSPDQLIVGAQWDFGDIKPVHLEPNVELSFGDDRVTLAGTFAVHYRFRHIEQFRPYAGLGLGVAFTRFDPPGGNSDNDFDIGVRAVGGFNWELKSGREAFVELLLGAGFPFDAQVMAGWTF